jgi:hypothetical protein
VAAPGHSQLQVPRRFVNNYLDLTQKSLPFISLESRSNGDETEIKEGKERTPRPVLLPAEANDAPIY